MKIILAGILTTWSLVAFCSDVSLENLLISCTKITDANERLSCYDKLVTDKLATDRLTTDRLTTAPNPTEQSPNTANNSNNLPTHTNELTIEKGASNPVVLSPPEKTQESELGEKYLNKNNEQKSEQVALLVIQKSYKDKQKRWIFEFENGQIWRQLESKFLSIPDTFPVSAQISEGVFGSYNLRIGENNKPIKVMRLK